MTRLEAAQRLNLPEHHIASITKASAGHLVELRTGRVMLVSDTVARAYVPEVDDAQSDVEPPTVEPVVEKAEPKTEDKPAKRGPGRPKRTY